LFYFSRTFASYSLNVWPRTITLCIFVMISIETIPCDHPALLQSPLLSLSVLPTTPRFIPATFVQFSLFVRRTCACACACACVPFSAPFLRQSSPFYFLYLYHDLDVTPIAMSSSLPSTSSASDSASIASSASTFASPMFPSLSADDADHQPTEIESYCVECGENVSKKGVE
jgi:hypothetical protein